MNASETNKPKRNILGRFFAFLGVTLLCLIVTLLGMIWVLERGPSPTVSAMFTRSVRETSAIRWISNLFLTDEELAKQLDVSVQTIRLDRLELGIPELRGRIRKMAENAQNKVKAIQSNEVVGELIDLELGRSGISLLKITEDMVFGKTQIAKGHFMFSQADSLAMAIVDAPMAVTGVANVKYKVPVHVGEKLIAKAEIVKVRGNKYFIWVKTHNETQEVFRAKFIVVSWGEK